jgi:hypothetical protein
MLSSNSLRSACLFFPGVGMLHCLPVSKKQLAVLVYKFPTLCFHFLGDRLTVCIIRLVLKLLTLAASASKCLVRKYQSKTEGRRTASLEMMDTIITSLTPSNNCYKNSAAHTAIETPYSMSSALLLVSVSLSHALDDVRAGPGRCPSDCNVRPES